MAHTLQAIILQDTDGGNCVGIGGRYGQMMQGYTYMPRLIHMYFFDISSKSTLPPAAQKLMPYNGLLQPLQTPCHRLVLGRVGVLWVDSELPGRTTATADTAAIQDVGPPHMEVGNI